MNLLKIKYQDLRKKLLQDNSNYRSIMEVTQIKKLVLNTGFKQSDKNIITSGIKQYQAITGLKPITTRAHKALAAFKLRKDMIVGIKQTLRGKYMWSFLNKLINIALPESRDFLGVKTTSFDQQGNFAFGITNLSIFPEVTYDSSSDILGMDIVIVTNNYKPKETKLLLAGLGLPFADKWRK